VRATIHVRMDARCFRDSHANLHVAAIFPNLTSRPVRCKLRCVYPARRSLQEIEFRSLIAASASRMFPAI